VNTSESPDDVPGESSADAVGNAGHREQAGSGYDRMRRAYWIGMVLAIVLPPFLGRFFEWGWWIGIGTVVAAGLCYRLVLARRARTRGWPPLEPR
jgi:hypothetical protein